MKILHFGFSLVLIFMLSATAQAGIFGEGLGGALRGAILGRMIDGRDGAAAGAVIGGLIGAGKTASRNKKQKEQAAEAQRRQAEWAAQAKSEREKLSIQPIHAAPQQGSSDTLVVETQKSLIRLGFEPGEIGSAGSALTDAVMTYQKQHGLLETGELSQALLTHMLRNGG
jgi:peptidoglycan hydrolase-like protein with peptidoglycan-binding domain